MPRESLIADIRKACVLSNPDILKLEFGCDVEYKPLRELRIPDRYGKYIGDGRGKDSVNIWFNGAETGSQKPYTVFLKGKDIEILGRKIGLADALLVSRFGWARNRKTRNIELGQDCAEVISLWNLEKDDLTLQSDQTLSFLHSLLKV